MGHTSRVEEIDALPPEKKAMLNRLKRVEGQLRGIQRMIVENAPCNTILIQLSAARKAMQQACIEILKGYVQNCLVQNKNPDIGELERLVGALLDIAPSGGDPEVRNPPEGF